MLQLFKASDGQKFYAHTQEECEQLAAGKSTAPRSTAEPSDRIDSIQDVYDRRNAIYESAGHTAQAGSSHGPRAQPADDTLWTPQQIYDFRNGIYSRGLRPYEGGGQ